VNGITAGTKITSSVTRLGEFSPFEPFLSLGIFTEPSYILSLIFGHFLLKSSIFEYGLGYILGDFFTTASGHTDNE
jgi:hypothetical protein